MDDRHDVSALWQRETRNLIEDCAAAADALAAVRQMVAVSGASALAEVVLRAGPLDGDTRMRTVAAAPDLMGNCPVCVPRLLGYVGDPIVQSATARAGSSACARRNNASPRATVTGVAGSSNRRRASVCVVALAPSTANRQRTAANAAASLSNAAIRLLVSAQLREWSPPRWTRWRDRSAWRWRGPARVSRTLSVPANRAPRPGRAGALCPPPHRRGKPRGSGSAPGCGERNGARPPRRPAPGCHAPALPSPRAKKATACFCTSRGSASPDTATTIV